MSEEQAIRTLFDAWQRASRCLRCETLLGFVTEDVVFLAPGQPPLRGKTAAGDLFRLVLARFEMEQDFRIEEIQVLGEWAFCWGVDSSTMRPRGGGDAVRARGMGLSLLRKEGGAWRFARGINNMTRESPPAAPARG